MDTIKNSKVFLLIDPRENIVSTTWPPLVELAMHWVGDDRSHYIHICWK